MADVSPLSAGQSVQAEVPAVPTQGASQFTMIVLPQEFLVTLGHSRVVMRPQMEGQALPQPVAVAEWFMTLALSPTSAMNLHKALTLGLDVYEKSFGKISTDPASISAVPDPGKLA